MYYTIYVSNGAVWNLVFQNLKREELTEYLQDVCKLRVTLHIVTSRRKQVHHECVKSFKTEVQEYKKP